MANKEHLEIVKRASEEWNIWRRDNREIMPDLRKADLRWAHLARADLREADLREADLTNADLRSVYLNNAHLNNAQLNDAHLNNADLSKADLSGAQLIATDLRAADLHGAQLIETDLSGADLRGAYLNSAHLRGANLIEADLTGAHLIEAELGKANLTRANLVGADFRDVDLRDADLRGAYLTDANLNRARLDGADLGGAVVDATVFAEVDLSTIIGLDKLMHRGPSTIGVDSLSRSKGLIPEVFLRNCGLSDWQIETSKLHRTDLTNEALGDILYRIHDLRAQQSIQISPLFISYSHADTLFVNHLERHLIDKGIRFWRDVHHATAGRLESQVDRAIRLNPTVLLILSENSVKSDWVEHEARLARKLEKETGRDVLCPIALDGSWKSCEWPERLREQIMEYNILDFSNWHDETYLHRMYRRLIEGLDLYYR